MGPAIILFRVVNGKPSFVDVMRIGKMGLVAITPKFIEEQIGMYLSQNDSDGMNANKPQKVYNETGISPHTDHLMDDQERKYNQMMEEVRQKQLEAMKEKEMEQLQLKKEMSIQRRKQSDMDSLIDRLDPEPKSGEIVRIAFRLPSGQRITRNFLKSAQVEVSLP